METKGRLSSHPKLITEFEEKTKDKNGDSMTIYPLISKDFYEYVGDEWGLVKPDAVELALKLTDEDYIENVKDQVLDEAVSQIIYTGDEYIDTDTAHIGSEGIDELMFDKGELVEAFREDREDDEFIYSFTFNIRMEGTSYEYWGRDGREIFTSSGTDHVFEGELDVEVRRKADIFLNISDDLDYTSVKVVDCRLEETDYHERDFHDEDKVPDAYDTCPKCGKPINFDNDAGNGFCIDCTREMDW